MGESKWTRITAIATLSIALMALFVSIWQGIVIRKHNQLSVRPMLLIEYRNTSKINPGFYMKNVGLGPAIIKGIEVEFDNKVLKPQGNTPIQTTIINQLIEATSFTHWERHLLSKNRVIQPGEEIILLTSMKPCESIEHINKVNIAMHRYIFNISYTSIYDITYQASNETAKNN